MMAEKIEGVAPLTATFLQLRNDMELRTARAMVVAGGGVLKKEAKTIAQTLGLKRTGALINNIAIKREKTPVGIAQYHLGVRHGREITKSGAKKLLLKVGRNGRIVRANDPFYWRFQELDTKNRDGTPFIGASLENKREAAIEAMGARAIKELEKSKK